MRFDIEKGHYGKVYDANGVEIPGCLRGDTDTGLVLCLLFKNGIPVTEDGSLHFKTVTQRHPAPLKFVPINDGWPRAKKTQVIALDAGLGQDWRTAAPIVHEEVQPLASGARLSKTEWMEMPSEFMAIASKKTREWANLAGQQEAAAQRVCKKIETDLTGESLRDKVYGPMAPLNAVAFENIGRRMAEDMERRILGIVAAEPEPIVFDIKSLPLPIQHLHLELPLASQDNIAQEEHLVAMRRKTMQPILEAAAKRALTKAGIDASNVNIDYEDDLSPAEVLTNRTSCILYGQLRPYPQPDPDNLEADEPAIRFVSNSALDTTKGMNG